MADYFLGLDLGGTFIKAGLVDADGRILAQLSTPTVQESAGCMAAMVQAGKDAAKQAGIALGRVKGVGILAPGQASLKDGIVFKAANLKKWVNVPLRATVTAGLGLPGVLENDANAAAYGEWWAGAGKGRNFRNFVMYTFGTGVGGGIILDGRVIRGEHDIGAELGHVIMVPGGDLCGCGQHGCMEVYTSAKYTAKRATERLKKGGKKSSLYPLTRGGKHIQAVDVARHAKNGDSLAKQVWDETCYYIALGCINAVHWLDPEIILLGGGMSAAGEFLADGVKRHYREQYWKTLKSQVVIEIAHLGNDAGIIGAAGVARDAVKRKTAVLG